MTAIENVINQLVPARYRGAAKAIYALVVSVLTAVSVLAGAPAWVPVVLLVLNAPLVYLAPNAEVETEDSELVEDEEYEARHAE